MARFTNKKVDVADKGVTLAHSHGSMTARTTLFASIGALVLSAFTLGVVIGYIVGQEPRHSGWGYAYNQPMPYYNDYGYYGGVGYGWDTPVEEPIPVEGYGGIGSEPGIVDDGDVKMNPDSSGIQK